jgi:uncharacterized membrane protein YedE/YeeE
MKGVGFAFGVGFGFVLAASRLTEYQTIHDMLRLHDLAPYGIMGSAVVVALPILFVLEKRGWTTPLGGRLSMSRSRPQRHHYIGGVLFGAGWAVAGTCPAPALGMVASGAVLGLVTIAGIVTGISLRDRHLTAVATKRLDAFRMAASAPEQVARDRAQL